MRALKNANYRRYFAGQTVSMTGTWMQGMVQAWLVYRLTHSAAWLGVVSFCSQAPAFMASPLAGVIADHADRRKTLILVESIAMVQALLLAALVHSGAVQIWHVAALAVVLGLANAFDMTLRHALTVDFVGKGDLISAISLNSIIINGSRILGPALAGVLIARVGEAGCFALNGLSYLGVIFTLIPMKLAHAPTAEERARHPFRLQAVRHEVAEAARYVWHERGIRELMLVSVTVSLIAAPFTVLLPVFAKSVLGGTEGTLATLSALAGLGGVAGALVLSARIKIGGPGSRPPAIVALCLACLGGALVALGTARALPQAGAALFFMGFFLMGIFPAINNGIQQKVDDRLRGRVMSLYTMTFLGAAPLGSLALGEAFDRAGPTPVTVAAGALMIAIAAGMHRAWSGSARVTKT